MLKEKRYAFPPVKMELAGDFFTILIGFTLEAAEAEAYDAQGAGLVQSTARPCLPQVVTVAFWTLTSASLSSLRHDTVSSGRSTLR